jgi:superfamily II DNA or RNA helicase
VKLRNWQNVCSENAIHKYLLGQKHFLCLATPGAGKTRMAAEVAKRLLDADKIDYIFCFSPSIATSKSMQETLEYTLSVPISGLIGSKGICVTYQSLSHKDQKFWDVFKKYRVFAIFDEIHHCGGNHIEEANVWAMHILLNVQAYATFTLALSGTPWRSDNLPVTLSSYNDTNGDLHCDYEYGLAEAIKDNVCRVPQITVIDNNEISFTDDSNKTSFYTSIQGLLKNESISYQALVETDAIIDFILSEATKELNNIRKSNPNAAGLIVASTVEHAETIAEKLRVNFATSVSIVSYKNADSESIIDGFESSNTEWLVSVGMVSEGTNIPRLQVCCHLTRIKTELHFRQILGRIIRLTQGEKVKKAYLFAPAQPQLIEYAERLHADIPNEVQYIKTTFSEGTLTINSVDGNLLETNTSTFRQKKPIMEPLILKEKVPNSAAVSLLDGYFSSLCFTGKFYTELVRSKL